MEATPVKRVRERFRGRVPSGLRAPVAAVMSRTPFLRRFLANARDLETLYAERPRFRAGPWHGPAEGGSTVKRTERVIEIPWVLSRYRRERRVLDIGTSFALPFYVDELRRLRIPELHGVDLAPRAIRGVRMTRADVRKMPFADGYFDLISCVSTIEHIGYVNDIYGIAARKDPRGDVDALREMKRVLAADGRILVTVPFGAAQDHGWFQQYDLARWLLLLDEAGVHAREVEAFAYREDGWRRATLEELSSTRYGDHGAPSAASCLCAELVR